MTTLQKLFTSLLFFSIFTTAAANSVITSERVVRFIGVYDNSGEQPCVHNGVQVGRLNKNDIAEHIGTIPHWYIVRLENGVEGCVKKSWSTLVQTSFNSPFEIHFLDVGTGDSAIINIQDKEIIIDGGNYVDDLHNYIRDNEIVDGPVELAIVTHGDSDHWKGFTRLFNFDNAGSHPKKLLEFWEPGYNRDCKQLDSYDTFIQDIHNMVGTDNFHRPLASKYSPAVESSSIQSFSHPEFLGVRFTLLYSEDSPSGPDCPYKITNASIVLKIEINGVSLLFTGDANGKKKATDQPTPLHVEQTLLALEQQFPGVLKADLLKVPHHGSETASTREFIDAVDPRYAIISASTVHHLPRPTVVNRYENSDRIVLRTDANRERNRDHIYCQSTTPGSINCNYLDVLQ